MLKLDWWIGSAWQMSHDYNLKCLGIVWNFGWGLGWDSTAKLRDGKHQLLKTEWWTRLWQTYCMTFLPFSPAIQRLSWHLPSRSKQLPPGKPFWDRSSDPSNKKHQRRGFGLQESSRSHWPLETWNFMNSEIYGVNLSLSDRGVGENLASHGNQCRIQVMSRFLSWVFNRNLRNHPQKFHFV